MHGLPARSQRTHRACYGPWRDPTQTSARGLFLFAANIAKLRELMRPKNNEQSRLLVAHSEEGKHPGQGGDNRKYDD